MNKYEKHKILCDELNELYIRKNKDYGDSFGISFKEEGMAMPRIRLTDKLNRFKQLSRGNKQHVKDESMRDTLIDIANYALMTIIEMEEDDMKGFNEASIGMNDAINQFVECAAKNVVTANCEDPVREHVNCTMTNCYYNDDHCNCMCSDKHVDPNLLEGCPLFSED